MELNKYQTPIELLTYKRAIDDKIVSIPFDKAPKEVQDEFNEIISTVPLVQWLISKDRPNIKDLSKDEKGRAIWKLEYPPIIENVDYFRKTAIHYQKTGRFTDLRPNGNPNSEYRKWVDSELDKIENGCLRPDGAWIPGYMYWFLNYCPIILTRKFEDAGDSEVGYRDVDFPEFWEGILWRYKGWDLARSLGQHFAEISKRGSSKSYTLASALSKIFVVGDRVSTNLKKKTSARGVLMAYQKEFLNKDGTLNKFEDMIDFIAQNTEFPRKRLKSSINEMDWVMGYTDLNTGAKKGTGNEILGVAIKDDPDKGRGKRASLIGLEEFGKFPNVSTVIKIAEPSVKDGDLVFGLMLAVGTGGEEGCLTKNNIIMASDGRLLSPAEVTMQDKLVGYNIDTQEPEEQNIEHINIPTNKPCVKITTNSFRTLECSTDHPIYASTCYNTSEIRVWRWVQAEELKVGDLVAVAQEVPFFGNKTVFDPYLLGILIGDGSYITSPRVTSCDEEIHEYLRNNYKVKDYSTPYMTASGKTVHEYGIKGIRDELRALGIYGQSKANKRIPNVVFECTKETISKVLAGLFDTDGCITISENKKGNRKPVCNIYFSASSLELVKQVQMLLQKLGVYGTILEKKPSNKNKRILDRNPYYSLLISSARNVIKFHQQIGLGIKYKQEKLDRAAEISKTKKGWKKQLFEYETVKRIQLLGEQTVYNMSVGNCHTYLGNGIITHNSDFSGALDLIYHPSGSHFLSFENVWDKESQVRGTSIFCFPAYVNRKGCYNKDGISDVTKALYALCFERYIAKYENPDPMQVTRTKAENPVTLQDAIMKRDGAFFPVAQIAERLQEIDLNPNFFDNILVGDFAQSTSGKVEFKPTNDTPIHKYNQKDNKIAGAFEIAKLPELNKDGRPYTGRYVAGLDPVDTDDANTMSFVSFFILDLWTDTIVCEWTGRLTFVDDCYEKIRLACMYYGAKLLYEAHPYSQKVITPTGIKTWKDITIGSELFAPNGNIVKVVDIPVNEEMPIYKVTLRDGREIEASDNHIWSVFTQKNRITPELKTTKEMMELGVKNKHGQSNFFIPKGNEIEFNSKEVPIDAYTMGLLLAEGCFVKHHCHKNRVQFSSSKEDLQYYKEYIPYKIIEHSYEKVNSDIEILNCKEVLKSLGLYEQKSHTKFIPDIYKYNSINIRTELLKGLMDGDGCSNKRGAKIFITTSERLCEDFKEVCRSLGINCSSKKIDYRGFSSFRVSIFTEKTIFKLPRKIQSVHTYNSKARGSKAASYIEKTAIEKIEFSHIEMGKCVTVDSKDGLYLIGDYVVTHNCNKKGLFAYFKRMNCLYLLAETPEFLKDKDFVKPGKVGNSIYGVNATNPINNYARELLKNWMLKPVTVQTDNDDAPEVTIPNVMTMWNRAALDEARQWNPDGNFDRISALGMLMLIREDRIITFGDNMRKTETHVNPIANDKYFERNYKRRSHNQ